MICPLRLALCLALLGAPALAQTPPAQPPKAPIVWDMPNEYPGSSIHGEGDVFFGNLLREKSRGAIVIVHHFDATDGLRSKDMLDAVGSGKVPIADMFAGALGDAEPIFLLPSLPFVAVTTDQARALFETAEAGYDKILARHNQKLLYPSPWPPTGIWAKHAIDGLDSLKGLRIRTYDANGTIAFKALGADPLQITFADALPRLTTGEVQAVLSSGDGGAGAKLWDYLDHFTAINYAMPLSLVTINLDVWNKLTPALQRAVRDAANATDAHQWTTVRQRVEENYLRMRSNLVTVTTTVPAPFTTSLKAAGRQAVDAWIAQAGPVGQLLLADYERRIH
ncbi:MAG: TRAP transporter substrate-binding protein [Pseudomonadota bacterium]